MTRRSIVAAISIFVHALVVFAAMTADMWRPITEWPTPRSAMAFIEETPRQVHLEDIDLPKPAKARIAANAPTPKPTPTSAQPIALAPVQPPSGISNETGREGTVSGARNVTDVESSGAGVAGIGVPVAPPAPAAPQPIRLHSGIRAPQRIVNVTPVYPASARLTHIEGMVIIEATIDEQGNVARAQILRSIRLLDDAALAAVRQWKFTPTLLNGVAVPIVMTVTVNFKLD
jgi:TonB family protein